MGFVLPEDADVEGAVIPLAFTSGQVRVSLMDSSISGEPSAVIDSFLLNSAPSTDYELFTGAFSTKPRLSAGSQYWLVAAIEGPTGSVSWVTVHPFFSGLGLGPVASRQFNPFFPGSPWFLSLNEQAAFQIEGQFASPVPEPSTFVLAGPGIALAVLALRRRRSMTGLSAS